MSHSVVSRVHKKPTVWGYGDVTWSVHSSSVTLPDDLFSDGDKILITIEKIVEAKKS